MNHRLTVKQLSDACKKHPYLLVRDTSGYQVGVNSRIAAIVKKPDNNKLTNFVSFLPCDFNTYVEYKRPFV